jgi:hypothetical protein
LQQLIGMLQLRLHVLLPPLELLLQQLFWMQMLLLRQHFSYFVKMPFYVIY